MATALVITERFRSHFDADPTIVASAPGRVNLMGEHTDYNDGFVLPIAMDRRIQVAATPRSDARIVAYAEEFDEEWEVASTVVDNLRSRRWTDYVLALLRAFAQDGHPLSGLSLYITGGIPVGAGVSSSAALEIALARVFCAAIDLPWEPMRVARLAQRAENDFVGVSCGIMDQLTAATGRAGSAILLDCRTLVASYIRVPEDIAIVVMDTGARRSLTGTDYNARRSICEYVVNRIRTIAPHVKALRDVNPALLETARMLLDNTAYRRARHVVEENARPLQLAVALQSGDYGGAGSLFDESHASLRDLFEVSSTHLDLICDAAREHPACYGARMTGAGFGGCAVALVQADGVHDFIDQVTPVYEGRSYRRAHIFRVTPDDGARLEDVA